MSSKDIQTITAEYAEMLEMVKFETGNDKANAVEILRLAVDYAFTAGQYKECMRQLDNRMEQWKNIETKTLKRDADLLDGVLPTYQDFS